MNSPTSGSCHCGSITFDLKSAPAITVNCHCDECKKRNGSAFSTYLAVPDASLQIRSGHELLRKYTVAAVGEKYFCAQCGSPIYNKNYRYPDSCMVFYGAFSPAKEYPPSANVYCSSKHHWVDDIGNIKSFPEGIDR